MLAFTQAQSSDLETVIDILEEAARWLASREIPQWLPGEFIANRERYVERVARGEFWLAWRDDEAVGTVALAWAYPLLWPEAPDDAGYVAKLAVRRHVAGRGVASALLRHADVIAGQQGKRFLRLDCWAGNEALLRFYPKEGFTFLRVVPEETWEIALFERAIV